MRHDKRNAAVFGPLLLSLLNLYKLVLTPDTTHLLTDDCTKHTGMASRQNYLGQELPHLLMSAAFATRTASALLLDLPVG